MSLPKPLVICVVGATAIGKTALAIKLAEQYATEILSADSRQFYKEMCIGTAVPSSEELSAAPHHFIQNISIHDTYSVGDFERDALNLLNDLFKRFSVVVAVGGSGLYIDALVKGLDQFPEVSPEVRIQLNQEFAQNGITPLQKELQRVDPDYYSTVDLHNQHRLIRALEVCRSSGKAYSSFLNKPSVPRNFDVMYIGLTAEREIIYDRINQRVDIMMAEGLLEEAKRLYPHKNLNALQTVGYRELFQYFDGSMSKEEAISEIKKNTRRFAKRQGTWFRRNEQIRWFDYAIDTNEIIRCIEQKKHPN